MLGDAIDLYGGPVAWWEGRKRLVGLLLPLICGGNSTFHRLHGQRYAMIIRSDRKKPPSGLRRPGSGGSPFG
jgi:hypothetical protein